MKLRLSGLAALVLGGACALPAPAQNLKPGLWEVTNHVGSPDGELQAAMAQVQQQMAQMDPAQRKMVEQMMAKHGVELAGGGDGAVRARMCVTPEMAARNEVPVSQHGDCTQARSPAAGGAMKVSFACTHPRARGEGELSFMGDTGYRMKMNVTSDARGKDETITMDATARWLGADCGAVKPFAPPRTD
jgi:hypothetical protein